MIASSEYQVRELENCPICLGNPNDLRPIVGCGHKVCIACEEHLLTTTHQHYNEEILNKKYIKCPMCRSFEKPAYEDVVQLLDHFCEKSNKLESQLYLKECELYRALEKISVLRLAQRNPATPSTRTVDLASIARISDNTFDAFIQGYFHAFTQNPELVPADTPVQNPPRVTLRRRTCQGNCATRITQRACSECRLSNCCRNCRVCIECQINI